LPLPLVERSREEMARIIQRKVKAIRGVRGCRQLTIRMSGKKPDVHVSVLLDSNLRFEDAHKIALNVEKEVKDAFPNARVAVNTEPFGNGKDDVWKLVKDAADAVPGSRGVHNIHIHKIAGKLHVDLHLEVSANMTVKQAHHVADQVEKRIAATRPEIADITVHIESASDRISRELAGIGIELKSYIEHVAGRFPEIKGVYGVSVRKYDDKLHLVLQCRFDPKLNIQRAHEISSQLESAIRTMYPNVARIDIHEEPA